MRKIAALGLVTAVMILGSAGSASAGEDTLEGTRWSIRITPEGDASAAGTAAAIDDVVVFDHQTVAIDGREKAGFAPSTYFLRKAGGKLKFSTVQVSPKEGKAALNGEAAGGIIRGTLVHTRLDGTVARYRFEGKSATVAAAGIGHPDKSAVD
jgi:hypothetical protein